MGFGIGFGMRFWVWDKGLGQVGSADHKEPRPIPPALTTDTKQTEPFGLRLIPSASSFIQRLGVLKKAVSPKDV